MTTPMPLPPESQPDYADNWELFLLKLRYKEGRLFEAGGNKPILFNDPALAWLIYSGSADVFATQSEAGQPVGARRFLFHASAGSVLFGLEHPDQGWNLLLSGVPGTQLLRVRQARLIEMARDPEDAGVLIALAEQWVASLSAIFPRTLSPKEYHLLEVGKVLDLKAGAVARPKKGVLWVKPSAPGAYLAGRQDIAVLSTTAYTPVTAASWIETTLALTLDVIDTETYLSRDLAWSNLTDFYRQALVCFGLNAAQSDLAERERLFEKIASDQQRISDALERVAGVLGGQKQEAAASVDERDPLLAACQMVGQALNVPIQAHPDARAGRTQRDPLGNIAKASRVRIRRVGLRGSWWQYDNGPLLGFIEAQGNRQRQPVALLATSPHSYVLYNPVTRTRLPVTGAVATTLEPFATMFYRPFPNGPIGPRRLLSFGLFGTRNDLLIVVVMGVLGGVLSLLTPYVTGLIFSATIPTADRLQLLQFIMALVASAIATSIFQVVRGLAMLRVEGRTDAAIQAAVWDRLLGLPARFFRDYSAGDLTERAMGISAIRRMLSGPVVNSVLGGLFSVFNIGLLFSYQANLTWLAIGLVVFAIVVTSVIGLLQVQQQRKLITLQGRLSGLVLQFINGISKFRVAGAEGRAFAYWSRLFTAQRMAAFRARSIANRLAVFNAIYPIITMMSIFAMIGLSGQAKLSLGAFVGFNAAFGQFLAAALSLSSAAITLLGTVPLYERSKAILQAQPEADETKTDPGQLTGRIEVNQLSFRYRDDTPLVLKAVSFLIEPGEFVALVGASGSGKSTMLRLLLGFETPESGVIAYDGQELTGLDVQAVRRQIGVVLQNGKLMAGDIFQNIIGSTSLTLDDAWEAARMAGIDEDIRQMPMGMYTVVSEGGSTLSGGQRQRILIARAIVHRPRLLFFDEATSALDNRTQKIVSHSLDNLNATRLVIAHRLSTIVNANRILVFDKGQIVQTGTYDQLMMQRGPFAELARRQLT